MNDLNESNPTPPAPQPEPSVLDYVLSKLRFWETTSLELQQASQPSGDLSLAASLPSEVQEQAGPVSAASFPWRSGLAVLFALIAQLLFEPSPVAVRSPQPGVALYLLAAAAALWAVLSGEWHLPAAAPDLYQEDPLTLRRRPLILGSLLLLISFIAFGGNQFNIFNSTLWLAGLFLLARSLWLDEPGKPTLRQRIAALRQRQDWGVALSPRLLIPLAIVLLALFFRMYRLDTVPPEMNSDHAEKLLDVYDVLHGQTPIFFERNTGREAFQFYLTALVAGLFGTGVSFMSLKIGTLLCGLATLPFIYLLGKEYSGRIGGTLAVTLAAMAYWPNIITRVALRFTLYPLFAASTLYFLLRGLRTQRRNDFILAGLSLGIGLHTYTPIRILPLVVVVAFLLYLLHKAWLHRAPGKSSEDTADSQPSRMDLFGQSLVGLVAVGLVAFAVFLPLGRYAVDHPDSFAFRAFTRLGDWERPLDASPSQVFSTNLWNALRMFSWDNGQVWPVSIPHRPALDVVTAALFNLGLILLLARYFRQRRWQDLFLLLSIPLLMLPSILALAFPEENPTLNRTSGALVPVFVIAGLSLGSFLQALQHRLGGKIGRPLAWVVGLLLLALSAFQNYNLVFNQYYQQYALASWNTSEMGAVIRAYADSVGSLDSAWVVAYPHWADTRLVGMQAGNVTRDYAIQPADLPATLGLPNPKLFLVNKGDVAAQQTLSQLYPQGWTEMYDSAYENKDFLLFLVPLSGQSVSPTSQPSDTAPLLPPEHIESLSP